METYVSRFQNTVTQFTPTRPIMDLCLEVDRRPGSRVAKRWWDQEGLELGGMQTAAWGAGTRYSIFVLSLERSKNCSF